MLVDFGYGPRKTCSHRAPSLWHDVALLETVGVSVSPAFSEKRRPLFTRPHLPSGSPGSVMHTRRRVEHEASRGSSGSAAASRGDASGVEGHKKPWHNGK
jgi:hypothetical protein